MTQAASCNDFRVNFCPVPPKIRHSVSYHIDLLTGTFNVAASTSYMSAVDSEKIRVNDGRVAKEWSHLRGNVKH